MAKTSGALKTVRNYLGIDPAADPQGFTRALDTSADARRIRTRAASDATGPQLTDPDYAERTNAQQFNRSATDAAVGPNGFNRDWVPFFESQNLQADINPGQTFRTNYGGLSDLVTQEPIGDQPTGMPRRLPPSLRSLARQGGG